MKIEERFEKALSVRSNVGSLRDLKPSSSTNIDFASNDYLGFARSPSLMFQVMEEWKTASSSCPCIGSTGSRLLTGQSSYVEIVEEEIAHFHKAEAGLLFNTGYMANSGLLSTVMNSCDAVVYDLHIHASMKEGIKRSHARAFPFFHQDMEHLEKRLKQAGRPAFVCVESLYSMDGQQAPLVKIIGLCEKYEACLIVDEAHATGIIGENGEGLVCQLGLEAKVFARVHTFGKALGAFGAIILGSRKLKQFLVNFCSSFIYTTSLPFCCLAAIRCAYHKAAEAHAERRQLQILINHFAERAKNAGMDHPMSKSPIMPIPVKGNKAAKAISSLLQMEGMDVRPILSPTVQRGHECLRICLHAFNTVEQVDDLIECLRGNL